MPVATGTPRDENGSAVASPSLRQQPGTGWGTVPAEQESGVRRNDGGGRLTSIFVPMTGNARREFRLPKQGYGVPNPPPNLDGWLDRPLSVITGGHPAPLGPAPDFPGVGSPRERRGQSPSPPYRVRGRLFGKLRSGSRPSRQGRGGSALPVRPSGFRPRIEYGAGFSPE